MGSPEPIDMTPSPPHANGNHKIIQLPQDFGDGGGQRTQIITMQGHEIIMFDEPSGMSKIQITTSDGSQQITMDEMSHTLYIGVADAGKIIIESDAKIEIRSRQDIFVDAPNINFNCEDFDVQEDQKGTHPPTTPKNMGADRNVPPG